jgi:AAA15 family ATPase/GTPase
VLGEPGIGKTTVVDAFLHSLESAQVQSSKSKRLSERFLNKNREV